MSKLSTIKYFLMALGLMQLGGVYAQIHIPELIPYHNGNYWGWCDSNKLIKIKPNYDSVTFFDENKLAIVFVKGKYGLINQKEKYIYKPEYKAISYLNEGIYLLTEFKTHSKNLGNQKGELIKKEIVQADEFKDSVSRIKTNKGYGVINTQGKMLVPDTCEKLNEQSEGLFIVKSHNRWAAVNKYGDIKLPYDTLLLRDFNSGISFYTRSQDQSGPYGGITTKGKKNIPEIFMILHQLPVFKNGLAVLSVLDTFGKYPIICGERVPVLDVVIDTSGKFVVPPKYGIVSPFYNNRALVGCIDDPYYGYINTRGEEIIPLKYPFCSDGQSPGGYFHPTIHGKLSDKFIFEDSGPNEFGYKYKSCFYFNEGMVRFLGANRKCGYIDTMGVEVIAPKYQAAGTFYEGLAAVALIHKFGFIDKKGKLVIECKYSEVEDFNNGLAAVRVNKRWFYIDRSGKEFTDP